MFLFINKKQKKRIYIKKCEKNKENIYIYIKNRVYTKITKNANTAFFDCCFTAVTRLKGATVAGGGGGGWLAGVHPPASHSHGHSGADGKPECRGRELPNSLIERTIRVCI